MKVLGIILAVMGIIKFIVANVLRRQDLQGFVNSLSIEQRDMFKYCIGALLADGLISILCGIFITIWK